MTVERIAKIAGWAAVGLAAAAGIGLVLGFVVQALWNWLMPELFGLAEITYWQAVGVFVLCHLLFKGHGDHSSQGNDSHDHHHPHGAWIRDRVHRAVRGDAEPHGHGPGSADPGEEPGAPAIEGSA